MFHNDEIIMGKNNKHPVGKMLRASSKVRLRVGSQYKSSTMSGDGEGMCGAIWLPIEYKVHKNKSMGANRTMLVYRYI